MTIATDHSSQAMSPRLASLRPLAIKGGIFVSVAIMIVAIQVQEPAFLRVVNIFSIRQAVAIVALLGIGVTISSTVGGSDLSIGALAAKAQMAAAYGPSC